MTNLGERGLGQSIDWKLVICYLVLVIIGWVNIYASIHSSEPSSILDFNFRCGKQAIWILTGIGLAALILFVIPPRFWQVTPVPFYIFVLVLLVAVIFLGIEVKGSKSWFEFGAVRFQPAEISKISTSLLLALIMGRIDFKLKRLGNFCLVALAIGLPMLVILAESETGSALVYAGFIFVLYREGLSGWFLVIMGMAILLFILTLVASPFTALIVLIGAVWTVNAFNSGHIVINLLIESVALALLCFVPVLCGQVQSLEVPALSEIKPAYIISALAVIAAPFMVWAGYKLKKSAFPASAACLILGVILVFSTDFLMNSVLQEHQRKRIEVLLGMKDDPSGVGYNVNQSLIAIGSGGLFGKGFLKGTQTSYGFVPEQSTDFIFCTVGEEWGFAGCSVVILLYVFMIWRLISDAENSRESFTRIYGYCVASLIFMHLFINIGMTVGIMPVIGIPLPFLSYGGSSLWSFSILLFIFLALYHQERKYF